MSCSLNDVPQPALPKGVEIDTVRSQRDQVDWLNVFIEGFKESESARPEVEQILAGSLEQAELVHVHFLARWEGEPCAISTLFRTDQAAGICNVTTLPVRRGHGPGAAPNGHRNARCPWNGAEEE